MKFADVAQLPTGSNHQDGRRPPQPRRFPRRFRRPVASRLTLRSRRGEGRGPGAHWPTGQGTPRTGRGRGCAFLSDQMSQALYSNHGGTNKEHNCKIRLPIRATSPALFPSFEWIVPHSSDLCLSRKGPSSTHRQSRLRAPPPLYNNPPIRPPVSPPGGPLGPAGCVRCVCVGWPGGPQPGASAHGANPLTGHSPGGGPRLQYGSPSLLFRH